MHKYLLVGAAAHCFKTIYGLQKPDRANLKTETYWDNRATPLPIGLRFLLSEEDGCSPQLSIQQDNQPDICLAYGGEDVGEWALRQSGHFGLPLCQPANTTGLFPDTKIQAYEECYQQGDVSFHFRQGVTYFALNHEARWVFVGSEPQAVYLTIHTPTHNIKGRLQRALNAAAALPAIHPAQHAQQLARMYDWWWGGVAPTNRPVSDQIPQLANLEMESKLAVASNFSTTGWQLNELIKDGALAGFTAYQDPLWVRHSHNVVRYLKGKQKLTLQGATHRFSRKNLGEVEENEKLVNSSLVKIREEVKPLYSPLTSFSEAQAIQTKAEKLIPQGDIYCHKRKFLIQSAVTGGGYHILIDHSSASTQPGQTLTQIEIECQWQKVPTRDFLSDPVCTAIAEIEQLTQNLCMLLPDVQPTRLGKRRWLRSLTSGDRQSAEYLITI